MINHAGLTITIITTFLLILEFVVHKWTVKVTKYYWFWLGIGIFMVGWYLGWKQIPEIINLVQKANQPGFIWADNAGEISPAFNLEICELCGLLLPLSLIIDPTRKLARSISPLAMAGGIFIVYGVFPLPDSPVNWGFKYFFIGNNGNLYVWFHVTNLLLGLAILLNTPKYGWKGYLAFVIATTSCYLYIGIIMLITGIRTICSGLSLQEWLPGNRYGWFASVFHTNQITSMCICLPLMFLLISSITYLDDCLIKYFKRYQFGNSRTNKWYVWNNPNIFVRE